MKHERFSLASVCPQMDVEIQWMSLPEGSEVYKELDMSLQCAGMEPV